MRIFPAALAFAVLFVIADLHPVIAFGPAADQADSHAAADDKKDYDADKAEQADKTGDLDLENRDINIDRKDKTETEMRTDTGEKDFMSVRRKKKRFSFHLGFGIGAFGGGIIGPRRAAEGIYRIRFEKDAFEAGFRGGVNLLFYLNKYHCISLGAFYEQRKARIKITDLIVGSVVLPGLSLSDLYLFPIERYMPHTVVDLNYFTFPVTYRYHITEEFYLGAGLDLAVIFQAQASYGILFYNTSVDLRKRFQPVDLGGTVLFGFTMNRVFVELAYGAGIMDIDKLPGTRRSMYATGTIGYRI